MSLDTLLDATPGASLLKPRRKRHERREALPESAPAVPSYRRMPATELLKALLGIRSRQRAELPERVTIRMSVVTPSGRNAIALWVNGRDSFA